MIRFKLFMVLFALLTANPIYAFTGTVTDNDGNGIPGAKIILTVDGNSTASYTSDNGTYVFPNLAGNTNYDIEVVKTGFPKQSISGNSSNYGNLDFILNTAQATLSGTTLHPDGTPISGAIVDAGILGTVVSDSQGEFSIQADVGASYSLRATALDMYFPKVAEGTLTGDTHRIIVGDLD